MVSDLGKKPASEETGVYENDDNRGEATYLLVRGGKKFVEKFITEEDVFFIYPVEETSDVYVVEVGEEGLRALVLDESVGPPEKITEEEVERIIWGEETPAEAV